MNCKSGRLSSLQCRRILGRRNLIRVRNIVVAAIFDFMTVEDWGEYKIVTLTVGVRAKEGKGGGGGEKKNTPARYHCSFGKLRTLANGAPDWCGIGK